MRVHCGAGSGNVTRGLWKKLISSVGRSEADVKESIGASQVKGILGQASWDPGFFVESPS